MRVAMIILLSLLSSFSFKILSQTFDNYDVEIRRIQLIVRGGMNVTTLSKVTPGQSGKEKTKLGYNVGLVADTYIAGGIYVQTGAILTTKGAEIKNAPLSDGTNSKLTLDAMYIQVPLLFVYKIPVSSGVERINIALGPYYAYGVGGKLKGGSLGKVDAFGASGVCNKSVAGFITEVHYETEKFLFFFGTDIGFTKVIKKTEIADKLRSNIRNFGFNLGVGYKI